MAHLPKPKTLAERLNYAVFRLTTKGHQDGQERIGTGYVCPIDLLNGVTSYVLVTNRHVLAGASAVSFDVHLVTENDITIPDSETAEVHLALSQFPIVPHPRCDLVAIAISPAFNSVVAAKGRKLFFSPLPLSMFLTDEEALTMDIVEPITMIGYPSGLWDGENKLPLFRRGYTASHLAVDFDGKSEFSVDIAVFSGSSGSPVFLVEQGVLYDKNDKAWLPKQRLFFLGTLWGGPRINERGEIKVEPVPTSRSIHVETGVRIHLGWAIKAKETRFLLDKMREYLFATNFITVGITIP